MPTVGRHAAVSTSPLSASSLYFLCTGRYQYSVGYSALHPGLPTRGDNPGQESL